MWLLWMKCWIRAHRIMSRCKISNKPLILYFSFFADKMVIAGVPIQLCWCKEQSVNTRNTPGSVFGTWLTLSAIVIFCPYHRDWKRSNEHTHACFSFFLHIFITPPSLLYFHHHPNNYIFAKKNPLSLFTREKGELSFLFPEGANIYTRFLSSFLSAPLVPLPDGVRERIWAQMRNARVPLHPLRGAAWICRTPAVPSVCTRWQVLLGKGGVPAAGPILPVPRLRFLWTRKCRLCPEILMQWVWCATQAYMF